MLSMNPYYFLLNLNILDRPASSQDPRTHAHACIYTHAHWHTYTLSQTFTHLQRHTNTHSHTQRGKRMVFVMISELVLLPACKFISVYHLQIFCLLNVIKTRSTIQVVLRAKHSYFRVICFLVYVFFLFLHWKCPISILRSSISASRKWAMTVKGLVY